MSPIVFAKFAGPTAIVQRALSEVMWSLRVEDGVGPRNASLYTSMDAEWIGKEGRKPAVALDVTS